MPDLRVTDDPPVVSVCIPTVDRLAFLRDAVASVAAQTLGNVEVVVGDNSAESSYQAAVASLASEFPDLEVRVHHHPQRLRMVDNANFLVAAARGRYWMYLPDDDRLRPTCLRELVDALDACPDAALAWCDHWIIDASGRVDLNASEATSARFGRATLSPGFVEHRQFRKLALRQALAIQCILFRTETVRRLGFDTAFEPVLDFDLELRLAQDPTVHAVYCPSRLVEYRVHGGQTTAAGLNLQTGEALIRSLQRYRPLDAEDRRYRRRTVARHQRALAVAAATRGDRLGGIRYGWQAVWSDPLSLSWVALGVALLPVRAIHLLRALRAGIGRRLRGR